MRLLRFFILHSLRDMGRNRGRTAFALVCVATGVAAVVALRSLAFMVADELTSNLAEMNRGDIKLTASRRADEITERSIYNGVMGRVLDTETLLRKNSYPDVSGHFTLTVHDALPSCAGTFTVAYANGHADVLRTDRPADVETDAPNLSRILLSGIGYTAEELPYLPNTRVLDTARAADFSRAFPRRSVHLMEHF